ncbi:MAG: dTDP-4-dehydrorhamnose reductase [Chitinivibrionales bacterium]|nr:dTDP-4-dehydrorhamnose reductase [Chitinivibrionales bacterium]MBD3356872.1 dTDP-4-dehydrorhamnose reductase [Chitinivibrionales bacterium]
MNVTNRRFLILGSAGQLAGEFRRILADRDMTYVAPTEERCDITDYDKLRRCIDETEPTVILNCAAYNAVDAAEDNPEKAYAINRDAVASIASIAAECGSFLVTYSSDYVFDGAKGELYTENDEPNPLGAYGRSKREGELAVMSSSAKYLLLRPSWVFGHGSQNFLYKLGGWAKNNRVLKVSSDEISVPTYTADMVECTLVALDRGLEGLYHLTNSGFCSRYELAEHYLNTIGADNELHPVPMSTFPVKAKRPGFSAMSNAKLAAALGASIPDWRNAVDRFVASKE